MGVVIKNNAVSTIITTLNTSDVGLAVASGTGTLFPTLGAGDYFYATLVGADGSYEIIKATARVGDTMTIVRAQEGTTAQSFASGSRIEVRVTAASINDAIDSITSLSSLTVTGSFEASSATLDTALPVASGGTGTPNTPTNGQLLIGNGVGYTLAAITPGSGVSVTNGAGAITIAATGSTTYPGAGVAVSTGSAWTTSLTAPSGILVGTTDSQTLTNKTISADNNTLSGITASSFVLSNASGDIDGSAAQKAIPSGVVVGTTDNQSLTNKTLTTGNTLDAGTSVSDTGSISATSPGFRGMPQSGNTTLALTDAGKHIYTASNVTIPANSGTAFPVGTAIVVTNSGSSTLTISITTDTLRQSGTTNTGTRTLSAYGIATLAKVTSTTWYISGDIA